MKDDTPYSPPDSDSADRHSQSDSRGTAVKGFRWQLLPALLSALLGLFYCLAVIVSVERLPDLFEDWDHYSAPWASLITSSVLGLASVASAVAMFYASRCWLRNRSKVACVLLVLGLCVYLGITRYGKWDWIEAPMTDVTIFLGLDPHRG